MKKAVLSGRTWLRWRADHSSYRTSEAGKGGSRRTSKDWAGEEKMATSEQSSYADHVG